MVLIKLRASAATLYYRRVVDRVKMKKKTNVKETA